MEETLPVTETTGIVRRIGPALIAGSALGSTLGIVIAQFLDDLGDGVMAELAGGDAVLFNNRAELSGAPDLALAGGFFLCLVIGFLALFSYPTARGQGLARLTLLWVVLHVLRQAFAQAAGLWIGDGGRLAVAYSSLDTPPGLDIVLAAAGTVGLLLIALSAAPAFIAFAPDRRLVSTSGRRFQFVLWVALIPAAVSMFLAIPFFMPDGDSGVVSALPFTAVMFVVTLVAAPGAGTVTEAEPVRNWPYGLLATLATLLAFALVVLRGGVSVDPTRWG